MKSLDYWEGLEDKATFIRSYGEGVGTQSREWLLTQIKDSESLLDVGCGPGCTYENLKVNGRQVRYRGLDFAPSFVETCRELFPEGDFQVGDAMCLDEPDNSWDTVVLRHVLEHAPHYREPIAEALRIARRRVIIVMWRPLLANGPDVIRYDIDGSNDYNHKDFLSFLYDTQLPMQAETFGGQRPNWGWVLHKRLDECVFDLDDFHSGAPNLDTLFDLKKRNPNLKVTLFTIPAKTDIRTLEMLAREDWIECAVHGWNHEDNRECLEWNRQDAAYHLDLAESLGCFARGFRPPGWLVSDDTLDELADREYWIASHWNDRVRVAERGMKSFMAHKNHLSVHGHMQDIHQNNPALRNGLNQLINERGLPWDHKTAFRFVSEMIK